MLHFTFTKSQVRQKARYGSDRTTATRVIIQSCRLSFVAPIPYLENIHYLELTHWLEQIHYPKIRAWSRLYSNMPLFQGRLLSNQDVPDIKRKHSQKSYYSFICLVWSLGVDFKRKALLLGLFQLLRVKDLVKFLKSCFITLI
jgi:hypothetical protein